MKFYYILICIGIAGSYSVIGALWAAALRLGCKMSRFLRILIMLAWPIVAPIMLIKQCVFDD